jgi:integrase
LDTGTQVTRLDLCPRGMAQLKWTCPITRTAPVARTIRDANLDSRTARSRLKARGKPYYRQIEPGLHLGYRKPLSGAGKWVVRHYIGDQGYIVETIATTDDFSDADGTAILDYRQAQTSARERMVTRARAALGKSGPYTVADAMDAYFEFFESEGRSSATMRDARYRDSAFIRSKLGGEEITLLRSERLRRWRDDLAKAPPRLRTRKGEAQKHRDVLDEDARRARRASANRTWTILRAALNHAFNDGKIESDVAWRKVKPFKAVEAARVRYLTVAEAQRLINACALDFRLLVQAALMTGARYGTLTQLTVADFNPDSRTVAIRSSRKSKPFHIVLTDEGGKFFRQVCAGRAGQELMLHKADGSAWGMSHQKRPIKEASERAKIIPLVNFHCLRHTWASHAVMNGVPLMVVAKNLGHVDTRMVEKHYGHLASSYVADAIRAGAPRFGVKASNVRPLA